MLPIVCAFAVAGCSMGIRDDGGNGMRDSVTVPVGYQQAFRRADAYARHCHQNSKWLLKGSFNVTSNLFTDNRTGIVHVDMPQAGRDLERIEVAAIADSKTRVDITLWGTGVWDQREMDAVKQSMTGDSIVCR